MKASKFVSTKIGTIGDMKKNTIEKVLDEKIIVIVRGVNKEKLIPFAEALYNGGIRLMEITFSFWHMN